ncbi:MAG: hydantoinase/oxoprolinase family protein, partial [Candidatus Bipolaricaulia bacterium]
AAGELVYTGALRTNPSAIVSHVPVRGQMCRVSPEYFTIMADVHLLLEHLSEEDYTCSTPDGRGKTAQYARERLARLVCTDGEVLSGEEITALARYLHEKQVQQISEALLQILSRLKGGYQLPLIATGMGRFLALESGRRLGLTVLDLEPEWGGEIAAMTPCLAVAYLLAERLEEGWQG